MNSQINHLGSENDQLGSQSDYMNDQLRRPSKIANLNSFTVKLII